MTTSDEDIRFWNNLIGPLQVDIAVNQLVVQALICRLAASGAPGAMLLDDLEKTAKERAETLIANPSLSEEERQVLQARQEMAIECLSKYFAIVRKQVGLAPASPEPKKSH